MAKICVSLPHPQIKFDDCVVLVPRDLRNRGNQLGLVPLGTEGTQSFTLKGALIRNLGTVGDYDETVPRDEQSRTNPRLSGGEECHRLEICRCHRAT